MRSNYTIWGPSRGGTRLRCAAVGCRGSYIVLAVFWLVYAALNAVVFAVGAAEGDPQLWLLSVAIVSTVCGAAYLDGWSIDRHVKKLLDSVWQSTGRIYVDFAGDDGTFRRYVLVEVDARHPAAAKKE